MTLFMPTCGTKGFSAQICVVLIIYSYKNKWGFVSLFFYSSIWRFTKSTSFFDIKHILHSQENVTLLEILIIKEYPRHPRYQLGVYWIREEWATAFFFETVKSILFPNNTGFTDRFYWEIIESLNSDFIKGRHNADNMGFLDYRDICI